MSFVITKSAGSSFDINVTPWYLVVHFEYYRPGAHFVNMD